MRKCNFPLTLLCACPTFLFSSKSFCLFLFVLFLVCSKLKNPVGFYVNFIMKGHAFFANMTELYKGQLLVSRLFIYFGSCTFI